MINLITNAFKFTDTGKVMVPQDKQTIIFERFSQLNQNPKQNMGGTGLGLPIVKGLVTLLGGEIFVESTQGEGSTFSFTIACKFMKTPNIYIAG